MPKLISCFGGSHRKCCCCFRRTTACRPRKQKTSFQNQEIKEVRLLSEHYKITAGWFGEEIEGQSNIFWSKRLDWNQSKGINKSKGRKSRREYPASRNINQETQSKTWSPPLAEPGGCGPLIHPCCADGHSILVKPEASTYMILRRSSFSNFRFTQKPFDNFPR